MEYVLSSFSLQMVTKGATIQITPSDLALGGFRSDLGGDRFDGKLSRRIRDEVKIQIGHEGTAALLANLFAAVGQDSRQRFAVNRSPVALVAGDLAYVVQPVGRRLNPGEELAAPDLAVFLVEVFAPNAVSRLQQEIATLDTRLGEAWSQLDNRIGEVEGLERKMRKFQRVAAALCEQVGGHSFVGSGSCQRCEYVR